MTDKAETAAVAVAVAAAEPIACEKKKEGEGKAEVCVASSASSSGSAPSSGACVGSAPSQHLVDLVNEQHRERNDTNFKRKCLFCKKIFKGERGILIAHMFQEHNFNIGHQDNLVNVNEFLDKLQSKIDQLQCIYCEKTFRSYEILKLHMRKKKHFKINARNHDYDRFYLINFLEAGKNWEALQEELDDDDDDNLPEAWNDWEDEEAEEPCKCLFCPTTFKSTIDTFHHMNAQHKFDFSAIRVQWGLDFYECIKLFVFIRTQIADQKCVTCESWFPNSAALVEHIDSVHHILPLRDSTFWRDAQFLFPRQDNDPILRSFEELADSDDDEVLRRPFGTVATPSSAAPPAHPLAEGGEAAVAESAVAAAAAIESAAPAVVCVAAAAATATA
eukprot:gnl/Hemi2/21958_TR7336_c0_g3_i1.p1 gnl/Hemi2/21958_TR7336_c0_g3~~gnl/Hemi2/21958_TR7336_c0_g3_i1.p1  ORF type:complete len:389 (+),score=150.75 gnl/Hemi2/21958_TR7336_c0_g3_i1:188-1354(+)